VPHAPETAADAPPVTATAEIRPPLIWTVLPIVNVPPDWPAVFANVICSACAEPVFATTNANGNASATSSL
jgi:hypothetical protein